MDWYSLLYYGSLKVQEKLSANKITAPRAMAGKLSFLTGLIKCGSCGSPMGVFWSGKEKKHYYMKCRRKEMNGKFLCSNKSIRLDELEDAIKEKLFEFCKNKDFIEDMIRQARDMEQNSLLPLKNKKGIICERIVEKEKEIENLLNNLKTVSSEFMTRGIEKEIDKISKDLEAYNKELEKLDNETLHLHNAKMNKQYLIDNYTTFPDQFSRANLEEKQILLSGIVKDISVDRGNIAINFF